MVAQHKFFKLHWKTLKVGVSTYFKVDLGFILYFIMLFHPSYSGLTYISEKIPVLKENS